MPRPGRARGAAILAALLAVPLLAATVSAQVLVNKFDQEFHERYDVVGRIVDKDGWPVNQLFLDVELSGLTGVTAKPQRVGTNCNGDFAALFDLTTIRGRGAEVKVRLHDSQFFHIDENARPEQTQKIDTLHRVNYFVFVLNDTWPSECGRSHEYWPGRVTVAGRFVNAVPEHRKNETKDLVSEPVPYWPVGLNVTLNSGGRFPPDSPIPTDKVGDFKYSWTFVKTVTGANVSAEAKGAKVDATIDPLARIAFVKLHTASAETSGRLLPAGGVAVALGALAALAVATRPKRRDGA